MPALFPEWSNTALKLVLIAFFSLAATAVAGPMIYVRTAYNTFEHHGVEQPVEFDHRHHVRDDGIDCLYCHGEAERSRFAGVPSTDVCMGCHNQIWPASPLLETVRRSYFTGSRIMWNRVHNLADFTYFDHSVHVRAGIGCVSCHGRVDLMPRVFRPQQLTMGWCLDCHRNPRQYIVKPPPLSRPEHGGMTSLWGSAEALATVELPVPGRAITRLTTCTACHR